MDRICVTRVLIIGVILMIASSQSIAEQTSPFKILPSDDSYVDNWAPDVVCDVNKVLISGNLEEGRMFKIYLKFKLPELTTGQEITSAELNIYVIGFQGSDLDEHPNAPFAVWRVPESWKEDTLTFNNQPQKAPIKEWGKPTDTVNISEDSIFQWVKFNILSDVRAAGSSGTLSHVIYINLPDSPPPRWQIHCASKDTERRQPYISLAIRSAGGDGGTPNVAE